ncbi:hypothetical protein FZ929_08585 [Klebsiella pneumoniae]|uniref:Uncharacterized protein n=1 Tax=Klebsiella pneumoniae TaxID=573 RepID=A0A5C2LGP9_KLEPN|nr:hypothetical protein FZ929_08585 [Klebsiella pneumoniae]
MALRLPTYTTPTPMLAQRRRAIAAGTEPLLCRAAADALPGLRCVRPAVKLPTNPAEMPVLRPQHR